MRPILATALVALAGAAVAAEPSMSHLWVQLRNVPAPTCMQRGRDALAGNGFNLAETTDYSQYATQGDYVGLVTCIPTQPTALVVVVSGPTSAQSGEFARRVRDAVTGPGSAPAPRPGGAPGGGPAK